MTYPILYDANATIFFNLGLGVLSDAISCIVTEERNGVFELEMEYPVTGIHADLLRNDMLIKADAGHRTASKEQRFRIRRIDKNADGIMLIYATHVSYLSQDLALRPRFNVSSSSGQTVLNFWRDSIIGGSPFTVTSDVQTMSSTDLRLGEYENARQVLGGVRGSILDRWGGEYLFDNYHISLLRERGGRANTLIAYGRNLTSLEQEENISNTFTSIYPYAIYRDDSNNEELVTINGYVVDSEHLSAFPNRRILSIDFSADFGDERPTEARLRSFAESYIRNNNVGVPRVSLRLSFVDLTRTLEFSGSRYEELNLCDTVPVRFEKLGINTNAKVIRIEWNVLLEQYDAIEIGDSRPSLGNIIRDLESSIELVENSANYALTAANGKNTVFFGSDEPTANRVGDLWYRPNGGNTELWTWNGSAWEFIMSTAMDERILDMIEALEAESELLWEAAQEAMEEGERALAEAHSARERAEEVRIETLREAVRALAEAELARSEAQNAFDTAYPLISITDTLTGQMSTVTALALGLQTTVSNNHTQTQTQITQLSNQIDLRVTSADFTSAITLLENAIDLRVTSADFTSAITLLENAIDLRVTSAAHQSSITALTDQINLRVTSADFTTTITQLSNQIDLRVTSATHQASITTLTNQINLRVTSADFTSQIQQLQNNINLSVSDVRNNIISSINVSPESIRIASRLIHLTGQTLIDNAVIRDAHIHSLNATKITVGTLNAANVNIINMNAANITTGFLNANRIQANSINGDRITTNTLNGNRITAGSITTNHMAANSINGNRIQANSITASQLATNAIQVGFNNTGTTLNLSSTGIQFNSGGIRAGELTSTGIQYWHGTNRPIGRISHNQITGSPNVRGLSFHLNRRTAADRGDYLSFGFQATNNASTLANSMVVDPLGAWSGNSGPTRTGVHMVQRLLVNEMGTRGFLNDTNFVIAPRSIDGVLCTYIGTANWDNGIAFGSNRLFLVSRGQINDWHVWRG